MMNLMLHSLQPSRGAVNFILAQLYIGVNTLSLPPQPPPLSGEILDVLQTISELSAQIMALQQRLTELTPLLPPIPVLASPAQEEPATIMAESAAVPRLQPLLPQPS